MGHRLQASLAALASVVLCVGVGAAPSAPSPPNVVAARIALRYDSVSRCPQVRPAGVDDEPVALVLFRVGSTGVPSKASIRASSGLADLDAAAMSCVMTLRFQPATRLGDGEPIDSWQQMSWKAAPVHHAANPAPAPAVAAAVASPALARDPEPESARVRVCVDATGRVRDAPILVRSSGNAEFDAAALNIARAASGAYRPATHDGRTATGCVQLTVGPDAPASP